MVLSSNFEGVPSNYTHRVWPQPAAMAYQQNVMARVLLLGLFAVASASPPALRGVEPREESPEDLLAEMKLLREEIAVLRAGQRGGERALLFGYTMPAEESDTVESAEESDTVESCVEDAPAPTFSRTCQADCSQCNAFAFSGTMDFSEHGGCVCVESDEETRRLSPKLAFYGYGDDDASGGAYDSLTWKGDNLTLTDYDDCVFLGEANVTIHGNGGDDVIDVGLLTGGGVYGGDGDDEINIENLSGEYMTVDGGDGDDSVYVGYAIVNPHLYSAGINQVLLGAGNDKFTTNYMSALSVGGGGGDDCFHAHVLGSRGWISGDVVSFNSGGLHEYAEAIADGPPWNTGDAGDDTIRVGFLAHENGGISGNDGDDTIEINFAGDMTYSGAIRGNNGDDTLTIKHGWIHDRPRAIGFYEEGDEMFGNEEWDSSFETVNEPKYNMKTWVDTYADD